MTASVYPPAFDVVFRFGGGCIGRYPFPVQLQHRPQAFQHHQLPPDLLPHHHLQLNRPPQYRVRCHLGVRHQHRLRRYRWFHYQIRYFSCLFNIKVVIIIVSSSSSSSISSLASSSSVASPSTTLSVASLLSFRGFRMVVPFDSSLRQYFFHKLHVFRQMLSLIGANHTKLMHVSIIHGHDKVCSAYFQLPFALAPPYRRMAKIYMVCSKNIPILQRV